MMAGRELVENSPLEKSMDTMETTESTKTMEVLETENGHPEEANAEETEMNEGTLIEEREKAEDVIYSFNRHF